MAEGLLRSAGRAAYQAFSADASEPHGLNPDRASSAMREIGIDISGAAVGIGRGVSGSAQFDGNVITV